MKKRLMAVISALALIALPSTALADPGAPGSTFPEAPGANLGNACLAVTAAPAVGGGTSNSEVAFAIVVAGLLPDACGSG